MKKAATFLFLCSMIMLHGISYAQISSLTWNKILSGVVKKVIVDSSGNYYAIMQVGVKKSADNGATWINTSYNTPKRGEHNTIGSGLVWNNKIFVGSLDNGMWISTDAGTSWQNTFGTGFGTGSNNLVANSNSVVMSYGGSLRGIYKFNSSNNSWGQTYSSGVDCYDLTADKLGNIYFGLSAGGDYQGGMFKSTDNGSTWTKIYATTNSDNPGNMDCQNDTIVYASFNNKFMISPDYGATWTQRGTVPGGAVPDIQSFAGKYIFASATGGIYYSADCGANWTAHNTGIPTPNTMRFTAYNNKLFVGSDSGLYVLTLPEQPTLNDGLVAYYPFNANANDESGNGNNGTVNGAALTTDRFGKTNKAYSFDGASGYPNTGSYIDVGRTGFPTGSAPRSIIAWFKLTSGVSPEPFLFSYGSQTTNTRVSLVISQVDSLIGFETCGYGKFIKWNQDTNWHSLTVVYPSGETLANKFLLYFDGALKIGTNQGAEFGTLNTGLDVSAIGRLPGFSSHFFNGKLDDIRIYNRALGATEIQALYEEGGYTIPPAAPTNLIAAAGNAQVTLKWNKVTDTDLKRYRIYRSTSSPAAALIDSTSAGNRNDTSKTLTGLANGTVYYFRVTAIDSAGNESGFSNEVRATPSSFPIPTDGLVAFYPFNGNANDESGNGNNGTVNGATLTTDRFGNIGKSYSFDGTSSYIEVVNSTSLTLSSSISASAWVLAKDLNVNYQAIVTKGIDAEAPMDWSFNIISNYLRHHLYINNSWEILDTPPNLTQNLWMHVVYTYDGIAMKIFLNGIMASQKNVSGAIRTSNSPLRIGAYAPKNGTSSKSFFFGFIDDIRIYNRALNASEILSLYNEGQIVDTTTTWKMQLKTTAGASVDNDNYLGISKSATDGFDQSFDSPKPPAPVGNYAQLYFPHPEWAQLTGDNYAQDIRLERALGDTTMRWKFDVKTNFDTTVKIDFVPDRIPAKFIMLLKDISGGTRSLLKTGVLSYSYRSGTGTNIRKFEILIGDSTAPLVRILRPNGGEIVRSARNYTVSYSLVDKSGIDSSVVLYSTNSGTIYTKAGIVAGNSSTYNWTAAQMYLNYEGSIKVTATDSMGNSASDVSDHLFTIVGDSLANVFPGGWSLTGLPLKPSDSTSIKIFGDDISQAFYQYEYTPTGGYMKSAIFAPGRGYWLGLLANATADVVGAPLTDSVRVPLLKGFNLISNPLVVPVPKDSLKFRYMGVVKKYAEALTANWIVTGMQTYKLNSYVNHDTLQLWNGYWFGVQLDNVEMLVYPPMMSGVPSPNSLPKTTVVSPTDWIVNVTATFGTVSDQMLRFGVKPDAKAGFDSKYDEPKAPTPPGGKYVEAYFTEKTWLPDFGNKFNADIRDTAKTQSWTFSVAPSDSGSVTLTWKIPAELPANISLTLNDGVAINMREATSYTFAAKAPRELRINAVGTSVGKQENVPTQFELSQNYPNPFNPSTTLTYALPADSRVRISIYNVLGQQVAELVNAEKSAGWYHATWNADATSGIYFYRMEAVNQNDPNQRFVEVKRMILMR